MFVYTKKLLRLTDYRLFAEETCGLGKLSSCMHFLPLKYFRTIDISFVFFVIFSGLFPCFFYQGTTTLRLPFWIYFHSQVFFGTMWSRTWSKSIKNKFDIILLLYIFCFLLQSLLHLLRDFCERVH